MGKPKPVTLRTAVAAVERHHALVVFPVDNAADPPSLWSHFHPHQPMRWVWEDEGGDGHVGQLWHLREQLSRSRQVVYAKWYRERATLLSRSLTTDLLGALGATTIGSTGLSAEARQLLESLEDNSPQPPRQLKQSVGLTGGLHERAYTRALRELWQRLLVVGYGEVADGAFPSLAIGATRILFEDLWHAAASADVAEAAARVRLTLAASPLLLRHFERVHRLIAPPA